MAALAVDLDELLAAADVVDQVFFRVQLAAQLVRVGHFQLAAELDRAAVGLQFTQQQLHQGGLAGTVGADDTDTVAALDNGGKIADHHLLAKGLGDLLQFGHDPPRLAGILHCKVGFTLALAPLAGDIPLAALAGMPAA